MTDPTAAFDAALMPLTAQQRRAAWTSGFVR